MSNISPDASDFLHICHLIGHHLLCGRRANIAKRSVPPTDPGSCVQKGRRALAATIADGLASDFCCHSLPFSPDSFVVKIFLSCPHSIKSIRRQIHGDAEFVLNLFQPHDAPLALDGRLSEVYGEIDRVADGVAALSLKEDTRGADVPGHPRRSVLKAYGHSKLIPLGATSVFMHAQDYPQIARLTSPQYFDS